MPKFRFCIVQIGVYFLWPAISLGRLGIQEKGTLRTGIGYTVALIWFHWQVLVTLIFWNAPEPEPAPPLPPFIEGAA